MSIVVKATNCVMADHGSISSGQAPPSGGVTINTHIACADAPSEKMSPQTLHIILPTGGLNAFEGHTGGVDRSGEPGVSPSNFYSQRLPAMHIGVDRADDSCGVETHTGTNLNGQASVLECLVVVRGGTKTNLRSQVNDKPAPPQTANGKDAQLKPTSQEYVPMSARQHQHQHQHQPQHQHQLQYLQQQYLQQQQLQYLQQQQYLQYLQQQQYLLQQHQFMQEQAWQAEEQARQAEEQAEEQAWQAWQAEEQARQAEEQAMQAQRARQAEEQVLQTRQVRQAQERQEQVRQERVRQERVRQERVRQERLRQKRVRQEQMRQKREQFQKNKIMAEYHYREECGDHFVKFGNLVQAKTAFNDAIQLRKKYAYLIGYEDDDHRKAVRVLEGKRNKIKLPKPP